MGAGQPTAAMVGMVSTASRSWETSFARRGGPGSGGYDAAILAAACASSTNSGGRPGANSSGRSGATGTG